MILVTGATGTIGRPLLSFLAAEGVQARAVTRDPQASGLRATSYAARTPPSPSR
jgi:uncharacterized protein YbjT (DUF2867 family)